MNSIRGCHILVFACISCMTVPARASEGTRLLRQPSIRGNHVTFAYAGDIWITDVESQKATRITSTPAVESNPALSPDGKWIAFTSNRSGSAAVYLVSAEGGTPRRLTWHPAPATVQGWTPDGKKILYATSRDNSPTGFDRLWTVSADGGPSLPLSSQRATAGSYAPDGKHIVIDPVQRWDGEWRHYRGGQNKALDIINLEDQSEKLLPYAASYDFHPVWVGETIYFLSDRDQVSNIWAYNLSDGGLKQITSFAEPDIKWLQGDDHQLVFERDGYLSVLNPASGEVTQLQIEITGDFPWAETKWQDVTSALSSASLSPSGKRIILEARGDVFTVPAENGDIRNLTHSSDAADRAPLWSPKGDEVAWFSDAGGKGYALYIGPQDGMTPPRVISIGDSKLAWEPVWSPDGKYIAFDDNKVLIRIVDVTAGTIRTIDTAGVNIERGSLGLRWSHDSKWLTYAKTGTNNFRQVWVWSARDNSRHALTNSFADSYCPVWDMDGHHLYFLASTDLALGSGWANTSSVNVTPTYAAYIVNLKSEDKSPFLPKSDEEQAEEKKKPEPEKTVKPKNTGKEAPKDTAGLGSKGPVPVTIDFDHIDRRTMAIPGLKGNFSVIVNGTAGTAFFGEQKPGANGITLQKYTLEKREAKEYASDASQVSVSADGKKMLARIGSDWKILNTASASASDAVSVKISLKMKIDRSQEWKQMFEEAWRYEKDYFYDPGMHGRNWDAVHEKYAPLIPYVRHRTDLNYILDQMNGELSVGHSFVFGGDFPEVEKQTVGLLGADLTAENGRWRISRIYSSESWNPELSGPLDRPGMKIEAGYYLVGINGKELTDMEDPYQYLDGTLDVQTTLHINKTPDVAGAWKEVVKPVSNEGNLRQRAWVEDNRRMVDKLSGGKLAYIWVPNTGNPGLISFNRYYFAQQDKQGAIIDERFNGGGLLDDYMVDLMKRSLRAAITNEVPGGIPFVLPAGILGPKVLLINELSGSGGDFFPWVFRQQQIGPLIGERTWGGLVKSSVHYSLVDGGALTAPDNAVFDPVNRKWIAENTGIAPDIEVRQDAGSLSKGMDPQLERAVQEVLKMIGETGNTRVIPPPFPVPGK